MNFGLWICSHVAQVISLKRFPHPARPLPIGNFVHTRGSGVTNDEAAVRPKPVLFTATHFLAPPVVRRIFRMSTASG